MEKRKRRWGDRKEGRRLRTLHPMSYVAPYIMKDRSGAQNLFADSFDISGAERYIRQKKEEGYPDFGMLHVIIAAYLRVAAEKPGINRFVSGQRIFARNDVEICMVIKKEMTAESEETCIKATFDRSETAIEVYEKFSKLIEEYRTNGGDDSFEKTVGTLIKFPGLFLRLAVRVLKILDYFGRLPESLLKVSPFHGSLFLTSMGSLGIPPVHHHLYNFGNLPVFLAYGAKYNKLVTDRSGNTVNRRLMDFTVSTDDRICDGFYYASCIKQFKRYIKNPWILDEKPKEIIDDVD